MLDTIQFILPFPILNSREQRKQGEREKRSQRQKRHRFGHVDATAKPLALLPAASGNSLTRNQIVRNKNNKKGKRKNGVGRYGPLLPLTPGLAFYRSSPSINNAFPPPPHFFLSLSLFFAILF